MDTRRRLIACLADGRLHSGTELAARLGISRSAVWKQVRALPGLGLVVETHRGRGYRLAEPLELLDAERIRAALPGPVAERLGALTVLPVADSTSDRLRAAGPPAPGRFDACLADYQTGGRGRRGRRWLSPFGSGLCLSVGWRFETAPPGLPALGLALGVAVRDALAAAGATGVGLKWPNDLVAAGGKLAGLLVDVDGEAGGPLTIVADLGLNVRVPAALARDVTGADALPPVGLDTLCPALPSRNALAASLLAALVEALQRFAVSGFGPFADAWRHHDALHGRPVAVTAGPRRLQGIAAGIAADGALLVDVAGELVSVISGEVSVRPTR